MPLFACGVFVRSGRGLPLVAALFLACVAPAERSPQIDLLGHRTLIGDPTRLLPIFDADRAPVLRVNAPLDHSPEATLVFDGERYDLAADSPIVRGDRSFVRFRAPSGPSARARGWLEVSLDGTTRRFAIGWDVPPEARPALASLSPLREAKQHAELLLRIDAILPGLDPRDRLAALIDRARSQQALGDNEAAIRSWIAGAHLALEIGAPTEATRRFRAAAFLHFYARRFREAERLLDRAEPIDRAAGDVLGIARGDYYRGLIAQELGEYRAARALLERADRALRDLGLDVEAALLGKIIASLLQDEGRHRDALALLERLRPEIEAGTSAVDRAPFLFDLAWAEFRAMIQGEIPKDLSRPRRTFEVARALIHSLPDPKREATACANLALVAFYARDFSATRRHLDDVHTLDPEGRGFYRPFVALLEAKLLFEEQELEAAEAAFSEALALSIEESAGRASDFTWRARHGLGQTRLALGDRRGGLAELRLARQEMDLLARRTALTDARAPFFADRRTLIDDLFSALLAAGELEEAFAVQDAARANVLRALEAEVRIARLDPAGRDQWAERLERLARAKDALETSRVQSELLAGPALRAWKDQRQIETKALKEAFDEAYAYLDGAAPESPAPADTAAQLARALGPDEALIAFTRLADQWHVFAVGAAFGDRRLVHQTLSDAVPAGAILGRLLPSIRHLYVVTGGHPKALQLTLDRDERGVRLIERVSSSELPYAAVLLRSPLDRPQGPALIAADPDRNLPFARKEAEAVATRLSDAVIVSGSAANRTRIFTALDGARVFHFAGHGVLQPGQPWDAHLSLAGEETMSLADVLIRRPNIGLVVLSGCETGKTEALSEDEAVGLPEAFLAAGARSVLATDRPIMDRAALRFIEHFYDAGGAAAPAEALRQAALDAETRGDDAGRAFRLVGLR